MKPARPLSPRLLEPAEAPTDAALVLRAREGDDYAFDLLYRRHVQFVAAVALRLGGRREDLEDVVQQAFVIAFDKLDRLNDPRAFRGWLAQITISVARRRARWSRWHRLFRDSVEEETTLAAMVSSDASPDVHAQLAQIDASLLMLPKAERTAWVLRFGLGCTLEEVADGCGCSLATAKRRLSQARATMGDVVELEDES